MTQAELEDLIKQPEGSTLDFKRDFSSPYNVIKTIAAIANTANGHVAIGIADDGTVRGLSRPKEVEEGLSNALTSLVEPLLLVSVEHYVLKGKSILLVEIPFLARPFYMRGEKKGSKKVVYVREGSTCVLADQAIIAELRRLGQSQGYDMETVPFILASELDKKRIKGAFGRSLSSIKLRNFGLAADRASKIVATHAGVILFGSNEQRLIYAMNAKMTCTAFKGTDKASILDEGLEFEGKTVLESLDLFQSFVDRNEQHGSVFLGGIKRKDLTKYDAKILRELIVNAVAHANYESVGEQINVHMFDDRIEIISPGRFPPNITVKSIKEDGASTIRNNGIYLTLKHLDIMERLGSCWDRMKESFRRGYPEPIWEVVSGMVKVTVPAHPHFLGARTRLTESERLDQIIRVLETGDHSPAELGSKISLAPRTTRRYIAILVEQGKIVMVGNGLQDPNLKYRLCSSDSQTQDPPESS